MAIAEGGHGHAEAQRGQVRFADQIRDGGGDTRHGDTGDSVLANGVNRDGGEDHCQQPDEPQGDRGWQVARVALRDHKLLEGIQQRVGDQRRHGADEQPPQEEAIEADHSLTCSPGLGMDSSGCVSDPGDVRHAAAGAAEGALV